MKREQNFYQDQRPIKSNSAGKYNLNFIDQTNDLASYCNGELPELDDLIKSHFQTMTYLQYKNIKNHFVPAIDLCKSDLFTSKQKVAQNNNKKNQTQNINSHCSVCTMDFLDQQQIKVLPCGHCFHKECIKPWFQVNSKCPNCRYDLYQGKCLSD